MAMNMENPPNKIYRFEKKFVIDQSEIYSFLKDLKSNGFSEIYYKRRINNLYLDTLNHQALYDNIEGLSSREKIRIRWYGELFDLSKKVLEFKIKLEDVGRKEHLSLHELKLESLETIDIFYNQIVSKIELYDKELLYGKQFYALQPSILNSYQREYFISLDEKIRLTLDQNVYYTSPIFKSEYFDPKVVIELKSDSNVIMSNMFNNLEISKNSKYVKGVLCTSYVNVEY
jgi:SPX domain protein involved in polyphosphate accumulation